MTSTTRSVLLASGALLLLAGCGGSRDATQDGVRNDVADVLVEQGRGGREFTQAEADDVATCVAESMFQSDQFTKDERNEAASHLDGDRHDEALVAKVEALVDDCLGEATTAGPEAPSD